MIYFEYFDKSFEEDTDKMDDDNTSITDNNNDEHALSIYNTSTAINKEVFHIRSKTGDTYTAGDIYARGGIASETKVVIGDADNHFIVEKNNKNLVIYKHKKLKSSGHGFCGIGRKKLLIILTKVHLSRCEQMP